MFLTRKKIPLIVEKIKQLKSVSLVSDAGTPGISDPGYLLIRECINLTFQHLAFQDLLHLSQHSFNLVSHVRNLFLKASFLKEKEKKTRIFSIGKKEQL